MKPDYVELHENKGSYAIKTAYIDFEDFNSNVTDILKEYELKFHKSHKKFPNINNLWLTTKKEILPNLLTDLFAVYQEPMTPKLQTLMREIKEVQRLRRSVDESCLKVPPLAPYQLVEIAKGIRNNRHYFGLEMGLGKTYITISIMNHRIKYDGVDRILIICPPESMINFKKEILMFNTVGLTEDDFYLVTPTNRKPFETDKKIVICTYRRFLMIGEDRYKEIKKSKTAPARIAKPVFDLPSWGSERMIVFDEAHLIKNKGAKQTRMLRVHIDSFKYRYALSGTPAPKGIEDYWSQMDMLDPTAIGLPYNLFLSQIANLGNAYSDYAIASYNPQGVKNFETHIAPWVSRVFAEGNLDLPPLRTKLIYSELDSKQKEIYQEIVKYSFTKVKELDGEITTQKVGNLFPFILQAIENPCMLKEKVSKELSPYLYSLVSKYKFSDNSKLEAMDSLVARHLEKGEKIIIWSGHPATIDGLTERYGKKYGVIGLHGQTDTGGVDKDQFRFDELEKFRRNPKVQIAVLSYIAFNSAINLVEASISMYFDFPTDYRYMAQSMKRNHRQGSKKRVLSYHFVSSGTIEESSYKGLTLGKGLRNNTFLNSAKSITMDRWKKIFTGDYFED